MSFKSPVFAKSSEVSKPESGGSTRSLTSPIRAKTEPDPNAFNLSTAVRMPLPTPVRRPESGTKSSSFSNSPVLASRPPPPPEPKEEVEPHEPPMIHLVQDRSVITPDMTIYEMATEYPPFGWETVFSNADKELKLVSHIISHQGPYFPRLPDLFKAFDECPLSSVRVVILGQDPYHAVNESTGRPQANGMAFATSLGCPTQPSVRNIYQEIKNEYPSFQTPNHGDLTGWANQGVLLLNTCLTVKPHEAGSHKEMWNGFITKVLEAINQANPDCIYLLWGSKAIKFSQRLSQKAVKLCASHPSPFSASKGSKDAPAFFGCGHFLQTNQALAKLGKPMINWQI